MLKNKVFVVTGGANGIGKQLVTQLLSKGAKVAAMDIDEIALKELKKELAEYKTKLSVHKANIADKEAVAKLPAEVIKAHKTVDGLINNAGIIQPFVKFSQLTQEQIDWVMDVNFNGTIYMTRAFLPHFMKKKTKTYICNISSMGGFLPVPGQAIYGASKAAMKLFTEGLYAECQDTNIKVNIVFPGAVDTNIAKNSHVEQTAGTTDTKQKSYKMISAEKAASIIITGIEKEKFRTIVGKDSAFMDKLYRLNPKFAVNLIAKKMKGLLKK